MQLTKEEVRAALIAERTQLIALVEKTTDEQLQRPSLCAGWSNQNVLGHIIAFEVSSLDAFLLFFQVKTLDDINEKQARRYEGLPRQTYIKLLRRGLKRTLFILQIIPSGVFNKKFIRIPNGRISIGQLFGDLAMDRAIHYLDIAAPLGVASVVTEEAAMNVAVKFVVSCIDLLNPKIPRKFYGQIIQIELTGLCARTYYWEIGTNKLTTVPRTTAKVVLVTRGDTNDLLFTITVRPSLLNRPIKATGNVELEKIIRHSFTANALWEK
jgi:uncharacterized protein (TIGR03083 family)